MAVRNIKRIRPKVWIPPIYGAVFGLTVTRSDGTVDTVTDNITYAEIEDVATEGVGRFEFTVWNVDESYTGIWSGGEAFKYYKDYAVGAATTLRFRGKIEKVSYRNNQVKVIGRAVGMDFQEITVTKNYNNIDCSTILKALVDAYNDGTFTYTNVAASSGTTLTVNWYQKNFWDCVQDLCKAAGYDCYVDNVKDFHFFENSSRDNTTDAIVHTYNLLEVGDFGIDQSLIKNRIIVYGSTVDGVQVVYTAESSSSQSTYGIKEQIVNDDGVTNYTQAVDLATFLLSEGINPPTVGEVTGLLLATIQPGQNIRLSSPLNNLPPIEYNCIGYIDKLGDDFTTTVKISKEPRKISHIFKTLVEVDNRKQNASSNPEEMRYSYTFTFDSDTGSHTNTEIVDGVLKLKSGESSGTWVSPARTLDTNLDEAYLILLGETLTGATVSVTGNGGINYQTISNKEKIIISSAKGKSMQIKVVISDTKTQITALNMLNKLE